MKIDSNSWADRFAKFAADSYDRFRALKKSELRSEGPEKVLGQITFNGIQLRAIVSRGLVLIQGLPLDGTTHDVCEEFVMMATPEHQARDPQIDKALIEASRDAVIDATENVLEGLTPDYVAARIALARLSPMRVVTSQKEMPPGAKVEAHLGDTLDFALALGSKKPASAKVEAKLADGAHFLRLWGTTVTHCSVPLEGDEGKQEQRRAA